MAAPVIRGEGALKGLYYGFGIWLITYLWNAFRPLVYGPINVRDQIFWLIYTMGGFLAYGVHTWIRLQEDR